MMHLQSAVLLETAISEKVLNPFMDRCRNKDLGGVRKIQTVDPEAIQPRRSGAEQMLCERLWKLLQLISKRKLIPQIPIHGAKQNMFMGVGTGTNGTKLNFGDIKFALCP